jgi:hypothetical protein
VVFWDMMPCILIDLYQITASLFPQDIIIIIIIIIISLFILTADGVLPYLYNKTQHTNNASHKITLCAPTNTVHKTTQTTKDMLHNYCTVSVSFITIGTINSLLCYVADFLCAQEKE